MLYRDEHKLELCSEVRKVGGNVLYSRMLRNWDMKPRLRLWKAKM